jgi:hypothetical protein
MAEVGIIWADDADLTAISDYVENQRPLIPKFRGLQAKIEDYEHWLQGLGWVDIHVMINDTLAEAIRRKDEINVITGQSRPADVIPADRIGMKAGAASGLAGSKPPLFTIPPWLLPTAVVSGVVTFVLVVASKLRIL